ncbi:MAG: glycosyltransferase family 39 protein [Nitrospinae bacterium]|nr:glycosyltransferase family 39 protein [Nitrospinota bacterium]
MFNFSFIELSPTSNFRNYALLTALVSLLIHSFLACSLQLASQEAYYWVWSTVPSLSYYDHPPLSSWLIGISTWIFGTNEFTVRLPAILLSFCTTLLLYQLGKELFSEKIGFISVLIYNATIIFHVKGIVIDPDVPLIFFFLLSVYCFHRAIKTNKTSWWFFLGISTGLTLLSKYTGIMLFASYVIYLLLNPEKRNLRNFSLLFLVGIISLIVFAPVIIWNYQNDWISFFYQSTRRATGFNFSLFYFLGYFASQAGIMMPFIYVAMAYALYCAVILCFKSRDNNLLLLLSFALPTILLFTFASTRTWVKLNWLLPGYLTLIILSAAIFYGSYPIIKEKIHRKMLWSLDFGIKLGIPLILLATLLLFLPFSIIKDTTKSLNGWKEMSEIISTEIEKRKQSGELDEPFVIGYPYKLAAELAFYCRQYDATSSYFMGDNTRAFNYLHKDLNIKGKDALFVVETKRPYHNMVIAASHFESYEKLGVFPIESNGKKIREIELYLMRYNKTP